MGVDFLYESRYLIRTENLFAYIDDILIISRNEQEHLDNLSALFARLSEYGLRVSPHK